MFDGVCNLCNATVKFIIKKDTKKHFKFAAIQSDKGKILIEKFLLPPNTETLIYIDNNDVYIRSTAALKIISSLPWLGFLYILMLLPLHLRDRLYNYVARHRYKWFGKNECLLPTPELKERFI